MALATKDEAMEIDLENKFEQLKNLVTALRSRNAILADENNSLKTQLESIRSEMGSRLFDARTPMSDLIQTVDRLRETLAKKLDKKMAGEIEAGKPVHITVTEVSAPTASERLALELLDDGARMPRIMAAPSSDV